MIKKIILGALVSFVSSVCVVGSVAYLFLPTIVILGVIDENIITAAISQLVWFIVLYHIGEGAQGGGE